MYFILLWLLSSVVGVGVVVVVAVAVAVVVAVGAAVNLCGS